MVARECSQWTPIINNSRDDDDVVSIDSDDASAASSESDEFNGISDSDSSETLGADGTNISDALATLLESNRTMQAVLAKRPRKAQKVYVAMPDNFDGKIGDFIA